MLPADLAHYVFGEGECAGSELRWTKTEDSGIKGQISLRDPDAMPVVAAAYFRKPDITTRYDIRYDVDTQQIISTSGNETESRYYTPQPPSSYF